MKYIKTFERVKSEYKFKVGDYVVAIDSFIDNNPDNRVYEIEHVAGKIYEKRYNKYEHEYTYIVDYSIYDLSTSSIEKSSYVAGYYKLFQQQLRKATPEEILDYEMKENQIKYNL